jgi:Uma2 family endonuclease
MSRSYEETIDGATLPRSAPGDRHELICHRLHREIGASINGIEAMHLLPPRMKVQLDRDNVLCPDIAIVATATGKLVLAVEVISRDDHSADTVTKKEVYEQVRIPRLWIVDPRYDNVEIYHSFEFGLQLKSILAGSEILQEKLIPQFQMTPTQLFAA